MLYGGIQDGVVIVLNWNSVIPIQSIIGVVVMQVDLLGARHIELNIAALVWLRNLRHSSITWVG